MWLFSGARGGRQGGRGQGSAEVPDGGRVKGSDASFPETGTF